MKRMWSILFLLVFLLVLIIPITAFAGYAGTSQAAVKSMLDNGNSVTQHRIRLCVQATGCADFNPSNWKSSSLDIRSKAGGLCNRASFSMCMSWLGVDCTPVHMQELGEVDSSANYTKVVNNLNAEKGTNIVRTTSGGYSATALENAYHMFDTQYNYSPVFIWGTYNSGNNQHAMVIAGKISETNGVNRYIVINPSSKSHSEGHVSWIDVNMSTGKCVNSSVSAYKDFQIFVIIQWRRDDSPVTIITDKQLGVFRVIGGNGNLKDTPYDSGNNMATIRTNVAISSLTPEDVIEVTEVVGNSYEVNDPGNHQFAHLCNGYYIYYNHLEFLYEKVSTSYFPVICTQKDIKLLPFAEAANVRMLSGNTPLHVIAIYENKYGSIWYGVSDTAGGSHVGFVNINNVQMNESARSIYADGIGDYYPKGTIAPGGNQGLRGIIHTNESIYEVRAEVVSHTTGQVIMFAYCRPDATATTININSSVNGRNINNLMKFGTLPVDYYTYQVCVIFGYDDGNGPCIGDTYYMPEFTSTFQIGNPSGEDPLDDETPIGNVYVDDIELRTSSETINNTTVDLSINGTLQVSAIVLPSVATRKDIGWISSDTNIATVSESGLVTAYQVGQTMISCRAKDSEHYTATFTLNVTCSHESTQWIVTKEATQTTTGTREEHCNICGQVVRTETIPVIATLVSSIAITRDGAALADNASVTMDIGDEIQVDKIVEPSNATNNNVSWSSNNAQVVSVSSNGYLVALKNGTATITCSATDDSGVMAVLNVTVQCSHRETTWVTIREATSSQTGQRELRCLICDQTIQTETIPQITVPVSLIFLNRSDLMMRAGTDCQLTEEVFPANASNPAVVWESSDHNVASVSSSGVVVAKGQGTAIISCCTVDGSNLSAECVITVWENQSEIPVMTASGFMMPSELTQIDDEAFAGIPVTYLKLPESLQTIGSMAFTECPNLAQVFIPATVNTIASDAFEGSFFVSIVGYQNTAAEAFATNQGIPFIALDPEPTTITVPTELMIDGDSEVSIGSTLHLNGNVSPENATVRTVRWRSNDSSIATVSSDGIVTAVSAGTVTITAIADGDTSLSATKTITVKPNYTLVFDANGGYCDVVNRPEYSGYSLSESLPTASRDYYDFDGWYTDADGGTQVTQSTSFTSSDTVTIYAHWTIHPLSEWVLESQVPSDGTVEETSWSYRENSESTDAFMDGWTSNGSYWSQTDSGTGNYATFPSGFDTTHDLYTTYLHEPYTANETTTTKREVTTTPNVGFVYWHWMYNVTWDNVINRSIASARGQYTYQGANGETSAKANYYYFFAFASTVDCPSNGTTTAYNRPKGPTVETWNCANVIQSVTTAAQRNSNTSGVGCNRFYRFSYGTTSYTDYQKIFKYYREINYASSEPDNDSNITDIVKYVRYRVR